MYTSARGVCSHCPNEENPRYVDLKTIETRHIWPTTRRYKPYGLPHVERSYPDFENPSVRRTFQDSYEKIPRNSKRPTKFFNDVLTNKNSSSFQVDGQPVLLVSKVDKTYERQDHGPVLSYIGMIATAILGSSKSKLTLSGIYSYMENHFSAVLSNRPRWRNTVRHNLSLHECFVKGEIPAEGKGRFWHIHPNYVEQFKCGKFNKNIQQTPLPYHENIPPSLDLLSAVTSIRFPGSPWTQKFYSLIPSMCASPIVSYPQNTRSHMLVPREIYCPPRHQKAFSSDCWKGFEGESQSPSYSHY